MKKPLLLVLVVLFISSMTLIGVGCKEEAAPVEEAVVEEEAAPAEEEEAAEEEAKPFEGQDISVIAQGINGDMFVEFGHEWAEKSGARLTTESASPATYYSKVMLEFEAKTGAYDIVYLRAMWFGDLIEKGYLLPLNDYIAQQEEKEPGWYEQFFINDIKCGWGDNIYGIDGDGDNMSLFYRKDLFNDEGEKAAFKEKYGYDLSPLMTWDQFLDIAEFFTRDEGEELAGEVLDKPFYGTIDLFEKWGMAWWFLGRFASLDGPNPKFFDIETMEPRINNEAGVKSLENIVKCLDYSPPGALGYGYMDFAGAFLNGDVAMIMMWPDIGRWGSNPEMSKIIGKIGYAPLPGKLVDGEIVHKSMLAAGTANAISADSPYPDAAWDFIVWWNSPENIMRVVTHEWGGIDPYATFQLEDPLWNDINPDADEFLSNHAHSFEIGWHDLRITGAEAMYDKLGINIGKAVTGELTPKQAVDAAAKEWNAIIDDLGRDRLKQQYIDSISFELEAEK